MKYAITIIVLLLACSNPSDVVTPEPTEYSAIYEYSSVGGIMAYATYYNPETNQPQSSASMGEYSYSLEMTAYSGQTLWITITSEEDVQAFIRVNGEIVAESITADSIYVEYRLP